MKQRRSEVQTGRIGELYAAAIIEELGWQTAFCQQTGVDLLCWKDNKFYRCQVKSSTFHTSLNRLQFHFGIGRAKRRPTWEDYDFACCVSVPHRRAYFLPITSVDKITHSRRGQFFEQPDVESDTFSKTIRILDELYRKTR